VGTNTRKARTVFEDAGVINPLHPGARSEADVGDFLARLGLDRRDELGIGPGPRMTVREILEKIASGELSYVWNVPQQLRGSCLPALKQWSENRFDLEQAVPIPRGLRWTIYRKQ
jgi:hypothetical protein